MTWFNNWGVGGKLKFMNYMLLGNLILQGALGYWEAHTLSAKLEDAHKTTLPATRSMALLDMKHDAIRSAIFHTLYVTKDGDFSKKEELKSGLEEEANAINKYIDEIEKLHMSPSVDKLVRDAKPEIEEYIQSSRVVFSEAFNVKADQLGKSISDFEEHFESLEKKLESLGDSIEEWGVADAKEGEKFAQFAENIGFIILLIGLAVGFILPFFIIKSVVSALGDTIQKLSNESGNVGNSSGELHVSAERLAEATTEQAAALQETASSIEEMNAMVKKSADNSERSQTVSTRSHEAAARGKQAVEEMSKAIEEINTANDAIMKQTEESNKQISEIVKVITEIGNKTKVINDIVFQTKLLSFNASVEAARAGEHGKGFAVVAEEVGNLAQMSGNAAKEISDMLGASIKQVEVIVEDTKRNVERLVSEGKSKVDSGTKIAKQCGETLEEVVRNVAEVHSMISEISTATKEQSVGISEITKAMNQLDQITHQNSTTAHETEVSSKALSTQAETLLSVVNMLKSFVYGGDNSRSAVSSVRIENPTPALKWSEEISASESHTPAAKKPEMKWEPLGKTPKSVPGKNLMNTPAPSKKAVGTLEHIPSESDHRFKDF